MTKKLKCDFCNRDSKFPQSPTDNPDEIKLCEYHYQNYLKEAVKPQDEDLFTPEDIRRIAMEKRDKIRSPLLCYLYRLMEAPIENMSVFYVLGVILTVGFLLPFALLQERFIRWQEVKQKWKN